MRCANCESRRRRVGLLVFASSRGDVARGFRARRRGACEMMTDECTHRAMAVFYDDA